MPAEKFAALPEEDAKKIYDSDRTNDIHMEIIHLAMKISESAKEGITINLDPPCVALFEQANTEAWTIKQRSKAEIAGHITKGKWQSRAERVKVYFSIPNEIRIRRRTRDRAP